MSHLPSEAASAEALAAVANAAAPANGAPPAAASQPAVAAEAPARPPQKEIVIPDRKPGTIRYSTRVKGAPSKLLDELIATPAIKKRRNTGLGIMGRPPKKGKLEGLDRLYAHQYDAQRRLLMLNPMLRMLPPGVMGLPSPAVLGGFPPATVAAATLAPPPPGVPLPAGAAAGATPATAIPAAPVVPGTFRPGAAAASHMALGAFPAVPVAPGHPISASMAHDVDADWAESSPEDLARSGGEMLSLMGSVRCSALTPAAFFVAWNGVLTLSFTGFTESLARLKNDLAAQEVQWSLPTEQSGSKWPKLTLACLREGRTLTLDQLRGLEQLTSRMKDRVRTDPWRMAVRELSYVKFGCRSLERVLMRTDIPLKNSVMGRAAAAAAAAGLATAQNLGLPLEVPAEESTKVQSVLAELTPETAEHYLQFVNKAGGRVHHYQSPHSESSVVVFALPARAPYAAMSRPPVFLDEFRTAVDALLPDYYEWFPWNSLHCTVRNV